jgi:hypothetical protein
VRYAAARPEITDLRFFQGRDFAKNSPEGSFTQDFSGLGKMEMVEAL